MRGFSSFASVMVHTAVGAALLLGTTKPAHTDPIVSEPILPIFFEEPASRGDAGIGLPSPDIPVLSELPPISFDAGMLQSGASTRRSPVTSWESGATAGSDDHTGGGEANFSEVGPEVLAGPLPAYPELLRQAGVEGQVVLEARVDTTGRVQAGSISVVSASNPGFVEPARQSLAATLFRPARVNGCAVSMLVRIPFAFSIRGGTGRAR